MHDTPPGAAVFFLLPAQQVGIERPNVVRYALSNRQLKELANGKLLRVLGLEIRPTEKSGNN